MSDRDYLIVDDDPEVLRIRSAQLCDQGWSVASYTFAKLHALGASGALFLQHLKAESEILEDRDNRLQRLLRAFAPKESYASELDANTLIARLIEARPDSARGSLWAADVLFVTLRNFGVLLLAERQKFIFSYREILEELSSIGVIPESACAALLKLRFFKSLYRSGEAFASQQVDHTLAAALSALPTEWFPSCSAKTPAVAIIESLRRPVANVSAYHRLRNLEKAYVAASTLVVGLERRPDFERLRAWIENPRAYANLAVRMERSSVRSLRALISTKPSDLYSAAGR